LSGDKNMLTGELWLLIMQFGVLVLLVFLIIALIVAINKEMRQKIKETKQNDIKKTEYGLPTFLKMILLSGAKPKSGETITLNHDIIIGRSETSANIVIDSSFVSGRHTRIFQYSDSFMIEDLGSTNGTYLNGEIITSPRKLNEGDIVIIGDSEFKVI